MGRLEESFRNFLIELGAAAIQERLPEDRQRRQLAEVRACLVAFTQPEISGSRLTKLLSDSARVFDVLPDSVTEIVIQGRKMRSCYDEVHPEQNISWDLENVNKYLQHRFKDKWREVPAQPCPD